MKIDELVEEVARRRDRERVRAIVGWPVNDANLELLHMREQELRDAIARAA